MFIKPSRRHSMTRQVIGKGLSMLRDIAFVNGSLMLGWGGIGFYSPGYQRTIAILLSVEVILARLLENIDEGVKTVKRQSWLVLSGILWLIMNVVMAWSAHTRYLSLPWASPAISWLGVIIFTSGLALRVWSAHTLGKYFSICVTVFERHELIIKGPYRYCRHPAYLGSVFQITGLVLAFGSIINMIFLIILIALIFWRIRDEEALLVEVFRENYAGYQRNVPMLFPFAAP
jgi:protein-S-isoprenylcysteine O-methyltransferase Ste14